MSLLLLGCGSPGGAEETIDPYFVGTDVFGTLIGTAVTTSQPLSFSGTPNWTTVGGKTLTDLVEVEPGVYTLTWDVNPAAGDEVVVPPGDDPNITGLQVTPGTYPFNAP